MRKPIIIMAATLVMTPAVAFACPSASSSSVNVTCEQGVKVYRGTPLAHRSAPVIVQHQAKSSISAQRMALQNERLAAQSERIDNLETQLAEANKPKRRSRYGTTYFDSPFLFGNNRSFGRRTVGSSRRGLRSRRGIRTRH